MPTAIRADAVKTNTQCQKKRLDPVTRFIGPRARRPSTNVLRERGTVTRRSNRRQRFSEPGSKRGSRMALAELSPALGEGRLARGPMNPPAYRDSIRTAQTLYSAVPVIASPASLVRRLTRESGKCSGIQTQPG